MFHDKKIHKINYLRSAGYLKSESGLLVPIEKELFQQCMILPGFPTGMVSGSGVAPGEVIFESPAYTSWVVPAGVTSVCVLVVGIGGNGSGNSGYAGTGGGGGALTYDNNVTVYPGVSYDIIFKQYANGRQRTALVLSSITLVAAENGNNNLQGRTANGVGSVRYSGGAGVGGGNGSGGSGYAGGAGGAAGYSGNGGSATALNGGTNGAGNNGSGGGGGASATQNISSNKSSGGGGVGLFGEGASGAGAAAFSISGGGGGSGGTPGGSGSTNYGGNYGGGGGGGTSSSSGGEGGLGAIRIMWGAGRSFPNDAWQIV